MPNNHASREIEWPGEYVRPRDAVRILARMVLADIPTILIGPPGIGKSAIAKQLVEAIRLPDGRPRFRSAMVLNISYRKPTFVGCQPIIAEKEIRTGGETVCLQVARYVPPDLLPLGDDMADTLIIGDDISSAPPAVQAAFLEVLHEKKLGSYDLPRGTYQIGTANRAGDHIAAFDLSAAVISRGAIVGMCPDAEDLRRYALHNGWDRRIVGLFAFRPDLTFSFDPRTDGGRNFPTGRTWEHVDRLLKTGWEPESDSLALATAASVVGPGAAAEFVAFCQTYGTLPDPAEVYRGKSPKAPSDPAAAWAWACALASRALEEQDLVGAGARLAAYGMESMPGEYLMVAMRDFLASPRVADPKIRRSLVATAELKAFHDRFHKTVLAG